MRIVSVALVVTSVAALMISSCGSKRNQRPSETPTSSAPPPPPTGGGRTRPPPPPPPVVRVDCGNRQSFDSDGDGISDPVERNNSTNNYADLQTGRCDPDPTRPVGNPSGGQLQGGLNLPDRGSGYRHYLGTDRVDTDDWGTLDLLGCLEAVGRDLEGRNISLGIGDLSLRAGGSFPPHASHQNGRDVDLRYVRSDRRQVPLDLRFEPDSYDLEATKAVFEAFFRRCEVDVMFVDIDRIGFTIDGQEQRLVHVNGHSNHFHVRLGGS